MKHSIKPAFLCLFTVLFLGCLPHEKLTGRVIDTTGPVPKAAVLAMVWVEETDKAKPAPAVENLEPDARDTAYDFDMKERGLPVAYARAFSDKEGWFTLDKLHFSDETKKAVKAMKQPKITRITLNVFQRGYLKHAATIFPKGAVEDLPPATVILSRPESWKQLALDNYFRTLRRDEYDYGYSKEFGATKEEKEWFLEYTHSNLDKAYAESNIKGDKQWEEDCGHDYNDIVISTAGIQRNPRHEKCNQLLWQMGALREWEDRWLDHSIVKVERAAAAINVVKVALNNLGAEYAEVKANEFQIVAGVMDTAKEYEKDQVDQKLRNGLNESKTGTEEAQRIYNTGDKAWAYRVLGRGLYSQLPDEVRYGALTTQLAVKTIPGITDTVAGFYLLMNKPLTAQLPNGDNGNHKDKPGYKVEGSTETDGASTKSGASSDGNTKETAQTVKSKQRIEKVSEKGHDVVRFFDKNDRKIKDINVDSKETNIKISKNKAFDPSGFDVKISTQVAQYIEAMRKESKRDIMFLRRENKETCFNRNGKFIMVEEMVSDFIEYADADDSERADGANEFTKISKVYGLEGNKILELSMEEGWQPVVSNTGQFFIVTMGEYEKSRIINKNKQVLVEFNGSVGPVFFSANDRYILVVHFNPDNGTGTAALSVFDVKENKLELKKMLLPWSMFASNETPDINEDTRTMIIRHAWDPAIKKAKVDTVRF